MNMIDNKLLVDWISGYDWNYFLTFTFAKPVSHQTVQTLLYDWHNRESRKLLGGSWSKRHNWSRQPVWVSTVESHAKGRVSPEEAIEPRYLWGIENYQGERLHAHALVFVPERTAIFE